MDVITCPYPSFNGVLTAVEVNAWMSDDILYKTMDEVTRPCHHFRSNMLLKMTSVAAFTNMV